MVDYSKWKSIEISDDEDDTHPNIDTPLLFRWKHEARIQRMEEYKKEKEQFEKAKELNKQKIKEVREKLTKSKEDIDVVALQNSLKELEREEQNLNKREEELKAKERITPWNVDTISHPGFTKTIINKPPPRKTEDLSEEEREQRMQNFVKKNEILLKEYGTMGKYDDSRCFLQEHPEIVCEDTANYLVIWCINLEMEKKRMLSEHVAHQCVCMQFILELSKQFDVEPRHCVIPFFTKIHEIGYKKAFDIELNTFIGRVRCRIKEKLAGVLQEQEEEERQTRLGPGGLDPVEVFESLPQVLKDCFEKQDIPMLQKIVSKMPEAEAAFHMKRCIDSGLWLLDGGKKSKGCDEICQKIKK